MKNLIVLLGMLMISANIFGLTPSKDVPISYYDLEKLTNCKNVVINGKNPYEFIKNFRIGDMVKLNIDGVEVSGLAIQDPDFAHRVVINGDEFKEYHDASSRYGGGTISEGLLIMHEGKLLGVQIRRHFMLEFKYGIINSFGFLSHVSFDGITCGLNDSKKIIVGDKHNCKMDEESIDCQKEPEILRTTDYICKKGDDDSVNCQEEVE